MYAFTESPRREGRAKEWWMIAREICRINGKDLYNILCKIT